MIRPARKPDTFAIEEIAQATGLFQRDEVEYVRHMLAGYFAGEMGDDHFWIVVEEENAIVGVAYYAQEDMAPGAWNLYLLAVRPSHQSRGLGQSIVRHVEKTLATRGERILLIETSATSKYDRTRAFYDRLGYEEEARLRDYYAEGDDKVIFRKAIAN